MGTCVRLTNGYGRYITDTPEWALVFVGEWPLHMPVAVINSRQFHFRNGFVTVVSLLKPPWFQKRIRHLDPEVLKKIRLGF